VNIQVNIFHPAHFHLFKNLIRQLRFNGHQVTVCARNKEVTHRLLEEEGLEFRNLGSYRSGLINRLLYIIKVCVRLRRIIRAEKIDCVIGVSDMYGGLASMLTPAKAVSFTDTDHARLINLATRLFADTIVTPECCTSDFGARQIRYDGYHELAYLHPDYFTPDPSVRNELGLKAGERFTVLRFVSWQATHDRGHAGVGLDYWKELIAAISPICRVVISSERELPEELEKFRYEISPSRMHHVLAQADLFIGEGATMASECAVLGTPAIYVNSLAVAYCTEQAKRYGLVFNFRTARGVREKALKLLDDAGAGDSYQSRRMRMLRDKIDVTAFAVSLVEKIGAAGGQRKVPGTQQSPAMDAKTTDTFIAVS